MANRLRKTRLRLIGWLAGDMYVGINLGIAGPVDEGGLFIANGSDNGLLRSCLFANHPRFKIGTVPEILEFAREEARDEPGQDS
jgi:hypothetical protein